MKASPQSIVLQEVEFFFDFLEGFRRKTAFAIGEEFFPDIGAFGPGPELLFLLLGGIGLLESEPGAGQFEPFSEKLALAQACDICADFAEASPAGRADRRWIGPEQEPPGHTEGRAREPCGRWRAGCGLGI